MDYSRGMGVYGALAMVILAGFAFIKPATASWFYVAAFVAFELWLARRVSSHGRAPAAVGEAPYHFSAEEAELVGRYRYYFTYPAAARDAASVLAALGLSALLLAPWLTYKMAYLQAALAGLNLFAVARLTKQVAPLVGLRMAAMSGDREAQRLLDLHEPAWDKIRAGNLAEGE
jgi:hypothetical protein